MCILNRQQLGAGKASLFLLAFVLLALFTCIGAGMVQASEIILPTKDNIMMQTNGPDAEFNDGDWWTHRDHGFGPHQFLVEIPPGVNPDFRIELELWDPECYNTDPQSASDTDEQKWGAWGDTRFTLYSPTHLQIHTQLYPGGDATTNQQWVDFYSLRAGDYGPGLYTIEVSVSDDDENGYKLGIKNGDADGNPANGDEIKLYAKRTAFQYVGEGDLCNTFWFKVPEGQNEIHLYNFDMDADASTSVTYISPGGTIIPGTPSGEATWNTDPPTANLPTEGGDVIVNPQAGWWQAIFCVNHPTAYVRDGNQFIFWPNDLPFNGPPQRYEGVIGDRVWIDENQNGLQDGGEAGLSNVTVRLLNGSTLAILRTTTTNLSGFYQFTNVAPGIYRVEFQRPADFFFTAPGVGGDNTIDSDANPANGRTGVISIGPTQSNLDIDAGVIAKNVSDLSVVKELEGPSRIRPDGEALYRIRVTNVGPDIATHVRVTDNLPAGLTFISANRVQDSGPNPLLWQEMELGVGETVVYEVRIHANEQLGQFENCAFVSSPNRDDHLENNSSCIFLYVDEGAHPGSEIHIGDHLWFDTNRNGLQDDGENGMPDITVNLLSGIDQSLVASRITDALGNYDFYDVAAGSYLIEFVLPVGYVFTLADQGGNDAIDSDASQLNGRTVPFTVVDNNSYTTWDAGLVDYIPPPPISVHIGDRVWIDANHDGLQSPDESGWPNVTVNLLASPSMTLMGTTLTDFAGHYEFSPVPPGSYRLEFVLPDGYHFTAANVGSDDLIDSDADPLNGQTAPFAVVNDQQYLMWDAGMVPNDRADLRVTKVIEGDRDYYFKGEELTFVLTVSNLGPNDARNVVIIDHLPDGLELISATRAQDEGPNPLIWRESLIAAGGSVCYSVHMRTTSVLGGMDNCVNVSSLTRDPDMTNNVACVQVHILVPVELTSFTATSADGRVILNWTTQSEADNMGFHVLRAESEQGSYVQINKKLIDGAGNSSTVHYYRYIDEDDLQADKTYYYKLADLDYEGRLNLHGPVGLTVSLPSKHVLEQNYPNPFNPETRISFAIKQAGEVQLTVFNVKGEVVRSLVQGRLEAGSHEVIWDGRDNQGNALPTGMYIYTLRINNFEEKRTMMFVK